MVLQLVDLQEDHGVIMSGKIKIMFKQLKSKLWEHLKILVLELYNMDLNNMDILFKLVCKLV